MLGKGVHQASRIRLAVYALLVLGAGGYFVTYLWHKDSAIKYALALREDRTKEVTFNFSIDRQAEIPPWKPQRGALILVKGGDLREVQILDQAGRRLHHFTLSDTCKTQYPVYCQWRLAPGGGAFLAVLPGDGGPTGVQIVDLAAGEERMMMFQGTYSGYMFDWLDARTLFLSPFNFGWQAVMVDDRGRSVVPFRLTSRDERLLPTKDIVLHLIDSIPNGQGVLLSVFLTGEEEVWRQMIGLWDQQSGNIELFAPSDERRCENAILVPNRARFMIECAHHRPRGERLSATLYEASSGVTPKLVMTLPGSERLVAVSPNGHWLVLSVWDPGKQVITSLRVLDRQTGSGFTFDISVDWPGVVGPVDFSPDSQTLYYVESGAGGKLWRVDLATGSRSALAEGVHWVAVAK